MIGLAVELRDGPDVVGVHKRGTLDALEPQQKVVCSRVAVADGYAVHQCAIGQMAQRTAGDDPLVVDTVVAKPDVVGPRQLILRHVARQIAALPQRVVDENCAGERLLTVFFELRAVTGCRGEGQQHLAGGIAAAGGGVVHLLAMALDADRKGAGELCDPLVGQRTVVLQSDAVGAVVEHLSDQAAGAAVTSAGAAIRSPQVVPAAER